jgi:hypothetical protein
MSRFYVGGEYTTNSDKEIVIQRSLRGGDSTLKRSGEKDVILGEKHDIDDDETISSFFLIASDLDKKIVRKDMHGTKRALSFRDIARLILIDEETIIAQRSPIHSTHYPAETVEKSVFRLLLTGLDDSSIISKPKPKELKIRKEGKSEVLQELIVKNFNQLKKLNLNLSKVELKKTTEEMETQFSKIIENLSVDQKEANKAEVERQTTWKRLREIESKINVFSELQKRFSLLEMQYVSDVKRLTSISEASARLSQLKEIKCPICGADSEHQDDEHQKIHTQPSEVIISCRSESFKIDALLSDLKSTIAANQDEINSLNKESGRLKERLSFFENELQKNIQPRIKALIQKTRDHQLLKDSYVKALSFFERIDELEKILEELKKQKKVKNQNLYADLSSQESDKFSKAVEMLLKWWHFPNLDRVTFDIEAQDVMISGRPRSSRGKGVRAITHAAFNLGLMKYCRDNAMPHPGIVIIDSPLVVYREPDSDESSFSGELKDEFYRSLAKNFKSSQIIILENIDPPSELEKTTNVIKFTGSNLGRRGFIPDRINS